MPHFRAKRLVAVPAGIAYGVAADVAAYKEFLPLLEQSRIVGAVSEEEGSRRFRAELAVGYSKLRLHEKFTSNVFCDNIKQLVTATSQEPPFRNMKTVWTIRDVSGQAEVTIDIDYAMRNPLLQNRSWRGYGNGCQQSDGSVRNPGAKGAKHLCGDIQKHLKRLLDRCPSDGASANVAVAQHSMDSGLASHAAGEMDQPNGFFG